MPSFLEYVDINRNQLEVVEWGLWQRKRLEIYQDRDYGYVCSYVPVALFVYIYI